MIEIEQYISMAVEISWTDKKLLTTHGTPASKGACRRQTNSSALPVVISVIPVSQAERVTNLAKEISTTSFRKSSKLGVFSSTK